METADLISLLEDLEENIDDLEDSLEPLLSAALSVTTKKLPLLDRAKLYTVLVYSIESLLFSYLRLNGVAAKEHAVFKELTRVKQYFQKIKLAEDGPATTKPTVSLNKQATGRFIKQALAGNDRYDTERAEREAREKLLAARKSRAAAAVAATTAVATTLEPELPPSQPAISAASETPAEENEHEDLEDGEISDDEEMMDVNDENTPLGQGNVDQLKNATGPPNPNHRPNKSGRKGKKTKKQQTNTIGGDAAGGGGGITKSKKAKKKKESRRLGFQGNTQQELVKPG